MCYIQGEVMKVLLTRYCNYLTGCYTAACHCWTATNTVYACFPCKLSQL